MNAEPAAPSRPTRRRALLLSAVAVTATAALVLAVAAAWPTREPPADAAPTTSATAEPSPSPASQVMTKVLPPVMRRSVPTRVRIPSIGVNSRLMALGLADDGALEVPPGPTPAGWFTGAPTPGQRGPAVIAGHVRYKVPGVFIRLGTIRVGAKIQVDRKDGRTATFKVTSVAHYTKSRFPASKVYGNLDHAGLRVITCGGLDATTNTYKENVVVFADLVTARS